MGGGLSPWPGKSPSDKSPWPGKKDAVSLVPVRVFVFGNKERESLIILILIMSFIIIIIIIIVVVVVIIIKFFKINNALTYRVKIYMYVIFFLITFSIFLVLMINIIHQLLSLI